MKVAYAQDATPIGCKHDHPETLQSVVWASAVALAVVAMGGSMLVPTDQAAVLIAQGGFAGVFGVVGLVQFGWQQCQTLAAQDPRHLQELEELIRQARARGIEIEPLPCSDPHQMSNRQLKRWAQTVDKQLGAHLCATIHNQQPNAGQSVEGVSR